MLFNKASRVVGALATMFVLHGAASAASVGAGQFNLWFGLCHEHLVLIWLFQHPHGIFSR